jgi:hypothetical protein
MITWAVALVYITILKRKDLESLEFPLNIFLVTGVLDFFIVALIGVIISINKGG